MSRSEREANLEIVDMKLYTPQWQMPGKGNYVIATKRPACRAWLFAVLLGVAFAALLFTAL